MVGEFEADWPSRGRTVRKWFAVLLLKFQIKLTTKIIATSSHLHILTRENVASVIPDDQIFCFYFMRHSTKAAISALVFWPHIHVHTDFTAARHPAILKMEKLNYLFIWLNLPAHIGLFVPQKQKYPNYFMTSKQMPVSDQIPRVKIQKDLVSKICSLFNALHNI